MYFVLYNRFHIRGQKKFYEIAAFVLSYIFRLKNMHQDLIYYSFFLHIEHRSSVRDIWKTQYIPHVVMTDTSG